MIEMVEQGRVPIQLWTDGVEVEHEAMAQIRNVARLPVVGPHVAIMPDVHWGVGATVGSVIPTRAAIIPAAVGVDLGCVDANTEYLSPTGWRRIAKYEDGPIMQYDPLAGVGEFVEPQRFVKEPCSEMLRFKTKYGVDQMVTPDHRMLIWRVRGRDRRREMQVMLAADVAGLHEAQVLGAKVEFETTFTPKLRTA